MMLENTNYANVKKLEGMLKRKDISPDMKQSIENKINSLSSNKPTEK